MPRFAILIHDHSFLHWDLLVEQDGALRSWRLLESPERWLLASNRISLGAEPIPDHRLAYLEYEGPVSRERGTVQRWDGGDAEWLEESPKQIVLKLNGNRLSGVLKLLVANTESQNPATRTFLAEFE